MSSPGINDIAPSLPHGYRLHHYAAVGSSNDEAKALARGGACDGTIVWADLQTAGRGRRGRLWASPPGNLYLSLVLRPEAPAAHIAQLGFVAALALVDALAGLAGPAQSAVQLRCKWPNDVLAHGRKLAGILLEAETAGGERVDFVLLGLGVNIATAPADAAYPATSLAAEGIAGIMPATLLAAFIDHFERWRQRWQSQGFAPVRTAWLALAANLGEPIEVRLEGKTLCGTFVDLDADGTLLLSAPAGIRRIAAGDIFPMRPASPYSVG
ncbi:MAG: biotin--[acetyl-CoA-carboxylase] ligase [Thiohalocapsa sp.]